MENNIKTKLEFTKYCFVFDPKNPYVQNQTAMQFYCFKLKPKIFIFLCLEV